MPGPIMPSSAVAPSSSRLAHTRIWVMRMMRRRSNRSASAPATRPSASAGAVLAVCTSATISAEGVSVAISQAAIVACMVKASDTPRPPR